MQWSIFYTYIQYIKDVKKEEKVWKLYSPYCRLAQLQARFTT